MSQKSLQHRISLKGIKTYAKKLAGELLSAPLLWGEMMGHSLWFYNILLGHCPKSKKSQFCDRPGVEELLTNYPNL